MWHPHGSGLNACLLHWQLDSLPLGHQGNLLIYDSNNQRPALANLTVTSARLMLLSLTMINDGQNIKTTIVCSHCKVHKGMKKEAGMPPCSGNCSGKDHLLLAFLLRTDLSPCRARRAKLLQKVHFTELTCQRSEFRIVLLLLLLLSRFSRV